MRILLVHQYHHNPDCPASCRHYDFAGRWSRRHDVTILSSTAWQDRRMGSVYPWAPGSARLHTVDVRYSNDMGALRRAMAFTDFALKSRSARKRLSRPDIVVGSTTPLTAAWAAMRLARAWHVPFVLEVRDLWPDFPIEMGAVPTPLQPILRKWEADLYRAADHIVALSPDIAAHVVSFDVGSKRVSVLPHGTNMALANAARSQRTARPTSPMTVLYAGTFGRANDIPTILSAADLLSTEDNIRFLFAGSGFHDSTIRAAARRNESIEVAGAVPRHRIFELFAQSSASLVTFANVRSVAAGSPSKLFDSLATGCPAIVNSDGWTRRLLEDHQSGWYTAPEDPAALAELISMLANKPDLLSVAGQNAARLAQASFDRVELADRFEQIMLSLAGRKEDRSLGIAMGEAA